MNRDVILRAVVAQDFPQVHALYKDLVGSIDVPAGAQGAARLADITTHPGTTIFAAEHRGRLLSMLTLHVLPNMTFSGRPYALIENVVTLKSHRGQGLSRAVMRYAEQMAWQADAYKIMLLTGKDAGARGFYEKLGYTAEEKFGMTLRRVPKRQAT